MRTDRDKYTSNTFYNTAFFLALFCGALLGSVMSANIPREHFTSLSENIYTSFYKIELTSESASRFFAAFLKNSRIVLLFWFLGFLYGGRVFRALIIGLLGVYISYGISIFVIHFGMGGLFLSIPTILINNISLIIVCFWISIKWQYQRSLHELLTILFISLAAASLISLYEIYLSPPLSLLIFNALK